MWSPTLLPHLPARPHAPPWAARWQRALLACCTLAALAVGPLAPSALAANYFWIGEDPASASWSSALNWNGNGVPPNDGTADVIFSGAHLPPPPQLDPTLIVSRSIRALFFNDGLPHVLSGAALTIGDGGITKVPFQFSEISNPISLGADQSWTLAGSFLVSNSISLGARTLTVAPSTSLYTIEISGGISGTGSVVKSGSGSITLSGSNTYSGGTTIGAGTLIAGANNVIPAGTLRMTGGTLDLTGFSETVGPGGVSATGVEFSGAVASLPASIVIGTSLGISTLGKFISFDATNAAPAVISGGPLGLGTTSNTREFYVEDRPSLTSELSIESNIVNPGGDVGSNPVVKKTGAGRIVLGGSNTYARRTQVLEGQLQISSGSALGSGGSSNNGTVVSSGASLELSGGISVASEDLTLAGGALRSLGSENHWNGPVALAANSSIDVIAGTLDVGGAIGSGSSDYGITKLGVGTLVLEGANAYHGNTSVNAGTLRVANLLGSAVGLGTLTVASGATLTGSGWIDNQVLVDSGATLSPGPLPGSGGTLNVGAISFGSGSTTVMGAVGGLPGAKNDRITVAGGATLNGTLQVVLENGYVPSLGNAITPITYASRIGQFSSLQLPALPTGLGWDVQYTPTALVLSVSNTVSADDAPPTRHALHAPAPNPSLRSAVIRFDVAERAVVSLRAYDVAGREVARIVEPAWTPPGRYTATWTGEHISGKPLAAGTYFVRLIVNGRPAGSTRTVQQLR
jgi:autotransporter-associated beta strand protein